MSVARPMRIGLTGGIASGKSTVADLFAAHGVTVVDTDIIARQVVEPGCAALDEIIGEFGEQVIDGSGHLDRAAMRKIVFADDAARTRLEGILHPRIRTETRRQVLAADGDYVIVVVPLLIESPLRNDVDRVLVVDCSEDTQLRRLLARDAESEQQARRMLAAQASREQRLAAADDIIRNDDDMAFTRSQVDALHTFYKNLGRGL
ncbi:MAG: dephospho-CoA kinase [Woeseiaceae bacterium]